MNGITDLLGSLIKRIEQIPVQPDHDLFNGLSVTAFVFLPAPAKARAVPTQLLLAGDHREKDAKVIFTASQNGEQELFIAFRAVLALRARPDGGHSEDKLAFQKHCYLIQEPQQPVGITLIPSRTGGQPKTESTSGNDMAIIGYRKSAGCVECGRLRAGVVTREDDSDQYFCGNAAISPQSDVPGEVHQVGAGVDSKSQVRVVLSNAGLLREQLAPIRALIPWFRPNPHTNLMEQRNDCHPWAGC